MQPTLQAEASTRSPAWAGLIGAIIISFSAIFFELSGADPLTATGFRMVYALPVLFALWWRIKDRDSRPSHDRVIGLLSGVFLAVDVVIWQSSMEFIGTGLATLIANSQVVIVPLAAWLLLSERPGREVLVALPIVLTGLALITGLGGQATFGSRPVLGVTMAFGAAFLYSAFLMLWRRSNLRLVPTAGPLLDAVAGAAIVTVAFAVLTGRGDLTLSWPMHGWILALALGPQVVGWLFIGHSMPRLPSAYTSFIILLQPTLTLLWGRLIFDETPSALQYTGVAVVLAGIVLATRSAVRVRPQA
ncbi:MAG: DMT family transporter [Acidimicrobiia bacterium]|nr:DMT family transporter [Acidimicrobiia bacterium]